MVPSALLKVTCTKPALPLGPSMREASTSTKEMLAPDRFTVFPSVTAKPVAVPTVSVGASFTAVTLAFRVTALLELLYCVVPPDLVMSSDTST